MFTYRWGSWRLKKKKSYRATYVRARVCVQNCPTRGPLCRWLLILLQFAYIQSGRVIGSVWDSAGRLHARARTHTQRALACPGMLGKFVADEPMTLIIVTLSDGSNQQKYLPNQLTFLPPSDPVSYLPRLQNSSLSPHERRPQRRWAWAAPHYNHWPWRAAFRQSTAISNACQLITDGLRIKVQNFGHLMAQNLKQFRVSACRSADSSSNDMHYFHFAYALLLCIQKQNENRTDVAQFFFCLCCSAACQYRTVLNLRLRNISCFIMGEIILLIQTLNKPFVNLRDYMKRKADKKSSSCEVAVMFFWGYIFFFSAKLPEWN